MLFGFHWLKIKMQIGPAMSLPKLYSIQIALLCTISGCTHQVKELKGPTEEINSIFRAIEVGRIANDGGQSRGIAWGDYDHDGDPDLYVANANSQWNALYRNNGNGSFKKMTYDGGSIKAFSETVKHGGNSEGVNWVDYDNDGDLDLYVVSRGEEANLLFRNYDNLGFVKIEDSPLTEAGISASMSCWADIEGDGDLDVFIVSSGTGPNRLFKNLGEGVFERLTDHPMADGNGRGRACACGDLNDDGLPEFYLANAMTTNAFYKNLGNWEFEEITTGHLVEDVGYSYGVSWADYDDDGDLDLFLANFNKENVLYVNDGQGSLRPLKTGTLAIEKGGASKGHSWGDYDNDGDIDLYIGNGTYQPNMQNFLYLNEGKGIYQRAYSELLRMHADTSAGVAHADYDRDGDLDLFVANWGSNDQVNRFYENTTSHKNWVTFRLMGTKSNRFGIGTKITISVSGISGRKKMHRWMYPVTGYGSQNDYEIHFGLGDYATLDSVEIRWPSKSVDIYENIAPNTHYKAIENGELIVTN